MQITQPYKYGKICIASVNKLASFVLRIISYS